MEGGFLVYIILPVYELHLEGSYNVLPCHYEYRFCKLVVIDLVMKLN